MTGRQTDRPGITGRADPGECGRRLDLVGGLPDSLKPNGEPESGALARFAFHADVPAHQFDQTLADGQAQTGPAVLARCGGIRLREGLKQTLLPLGRDADPTV